MLLTFRIVDTEEVEVPDHIVYFLDYITTQEDVRPGPKHIREAMSHIAGRQTIYLISLIRTIFRIKSVHEAENMVVAWQTSRGFRNA